MSIDGVEVTNGVCETNLFNDFLGCGRLGGRLVIKAPPVFLGGILRIMLSFLYIYSVTRLGFKECI